MASIKLKGDTSGEVTIQAPAIAGTTTLNLPATSSTLATQNALGVRNLIINGDMRIDQRNGGASITANNQTFVVDRFKFRTSQSSKMTAEQVTDVPTGQGFQYSTKITSSSAYTVVSNDFFNMQQLLEGQNIAHLMFGTSDAKTVTLSFWVKSSLTGSFAVSLNNINASPSVYPAEYIINTANTWEKKTITIQGDISGTWDTDNTAALGIVFNLGYGSNFEGTKNSWNAADANIFSGVVNLVETNGATWQITGVQLEVGDTATPFEHRPYDMELQRCYRYYQVLDGTGANYAFYGSGAYSSTTSCRGMLQIENIFRALPTVTFNGSFRVISNASRSVSSVTLMSQSGATRSSLGFNATTSAGTAGYAGYFSSNADPNSSIEFDAEL